MPTIHTSTETRCTFVRPKRGLKQKMANAKKVAYYAEKAGHGLPMEVIKRDGRTVRFDINRIEAAVTKCFAQCDNIPKVSAGEVTERVASAIAARTPIGEATSVEKVQDAVELILQASGEFEAAKRYILHRAERANARDERPVPEGIREAFADAAQYFPTDAQQFMFFDKYSRYNYDLGRRETWIETVDRTVDFLRELSQNKLDDATYNRLREGILNMKAMPSMRMLASAGDYAREQNLALFNCSFMPVKDVDAFCEALLISMSGCGTGYSVESQYVEQFPRIKRQKKNQDVETHYVEDSTEGWIYALKLGLTKWFSGEDIHFNYELIRRAGLPLRRKGGRASGPEPLREMLTFVRSTILARQGSYLRTLDAHDMMCAVGQAAVQGGVRRTAMIALFDWDDKDMRNCKSGPWGSWPAIRANANNSAVWPEDLTQLEFIQQMLDMDASKNGEPGIFSRENANRTKPKRRKKAAFGTNPCLTGDTVIATLDGPRTFADLAETEDDVLVYAWDPDTKLPVVKWMRRPHKTRENAEILKVTFDSGLVVRATPDHSFYSFRGQKVKARDLVVGQSIRAFSASRDASQHERVHGWDANRNAAAHQYTARMIWEVFNGPIPDSWQVAHLDGDATNNDIANLQAMPELGHRQYDYPKRALAGFDGHSPNHKVISVEPGGFADVYNGCVDDAHTYIVLDPTSVAGHMSGIVSANCGEIILRPYQVCNLSIAVARADDDYQSLREKVELATIIGTIQSMAQHFPGLRDEWVKNQEEERLLGVDILGMQDSVVARDPETLKHLQNHAVAINELFAGLLGINPSAGVTCNKPGGNSSQLLNTASGLHARHSAYYRRNMRVSATSPVYRALKEAGVQMTPENGQTSENATTYVVPFPVKSPDGAVLKDEMSALDQLEFWLTCKEKWTEHNPSCTISYSEDELLDVIKWVWQNRDKVGGLSFLPRTTKAYAQLPYEEVSKDEYEAMVAAFPKVDFATIYRYELQDMTTATSELACMSGQCET